MLRSADEIRPGHTGRPGFAHELREEVRGDLEIWLTERDPPSRASSTIDCSSRSRAAARSWATSTRAPGMERIPSESATITSPGCTSRPLKTIGTFT